MRFPRIITVLAFSAISFGAVSAGEMEVPADSPFVFRHADVNVVVLEYSDLDRDGAFKGTGRRLSGLMQLDTLLSLLPYRSVGVVQLVAAGDPANLNPETVTRKLIGTLDGAKATVASGKGLVLYAKTVAVYERPEASGEGSPLGDLDELKAFQVLESRGEWMRIASRTGVSGWVNAGATIAGEPLRTKLPELQYVTGLAGYLAHRVACNRDAEGRANQKFVSLAATAFERYEALSGRVAPLLPVVVSKQLTGMMKLEGRPIEPEQVASAHRSFEAALRLAPYSPEARTLELVGRIGVEHWVAPAYREALTAKVGSPLLRSAADDLALTLALNSDNPPARANYDALYQLVQAKPPQEARASGFSEDRLEEMAILLGRNRPGSNKVPAKLEWATTDPEVIITTQKPPKFPEIAQKARLSGAVTVEVHILSDGTVDVVSVIGSSNPNVGFEESVIQAIRQWQFEPATLDGKPIDDVLTFRLNFRSGDLGSAQGEPRISVAAIEGAAATSGSRDF